MFVDEFGFCDLHHRQDHRGRADRSRRSGKRAAPGAGGAIQRDRRRPGLFGAGDMDPRGKIDRYIWSWAGHGGKKPATFAHVAQKSNRDPPIYLSGSRPEWTRSASLRFEGTQTETARPCPSRRRARQIRDAFVCISQSPAWWEQITCRSGLRTPSPAPGQGPHRGSRRRLQSDEPRGRQLAHNTLVYFPDWGADGAARTRGARHGRDAPLQGLARPHRRVYSRRSDLEARLGAVSDGFAGA